MSEQSSEQPTGQYYVVTRTVETLKGPEQRHQLVNRERQRGKRFRAEHGGLSGRQFRKARKAGNRLAREQGKAA